MFYQNVLNYATFRIVAIETAGGKRNLNININAQQAILKAFTSKQFKFI